MSHILNKKILIIFLTVGLLSALLVIIPLIGRAATLKAQDTVFLSSDQVVDGNLIVTANIVEIQGTVHGDVIAFANSLTISGSVFGDVIALGNNVRINGRVDGNVRVAASTLQIDSEVGKNVSAAAGTILLTKQSKINWSLWALAGTLQQRGEVRGDLEAKTGRAIIGGAVKGTVNLTVKEAPPVISKEASLFGDFNYRSPGEAVIDQDAKIIGQVNYLPLLTAKPGFWRQPNFTVALLAKFLSLFAWWASGLFLVALVGHRLDKITHLMITKPWRSLFTGFVYVIFLPVLFIILAGTLIGLPAALIGAAIFFIVLYLSQLFTGLTIGQELLHLITRRRKKPKALWSMVVGLLIYRLVTLIPIVGEMIFILATLWGFGAWLIVTKRFVTKAAK